jgi:hypothetical protein
VEDEFGVEFVDEVEVGVEIRLDVVSDGGCVTLEASSDSLYFGALT